VEAGLVDPSSAYNLSDFLSGPFDALMDPGAQPAIFIAPHGQCQADMRLVANATDNPPSPHILPKAIFHQVLQMDLPFLPPCISPR
jgi:hypothetical protein